jgi:3-hydroxybutyryl-CoA dehydrogenase
MMKAESVNQVLIVGAGIMGEGIIQNFIQSGIAVNVVDKSPEIMSKCSSQLEANLDLFQKFDLVKETPASIMKRVKFFPAEQINEAAQDCQFVIETVVELLEVKKSVFAQLDSLPKDIVLASNTSSITISTLTDQMRTPERVVGLHFFNPANIIPLVEIHRGKKTDDKAVVFTKDLMTRVGKKAVLVRKEVPGFIINRLTGAMEREIDYLLDEGIVTPEDLDDAVKASFGFRLSCIGPMEAEDMIGLDTASRSSTNIFKVLSNRIDPSPALIEKVKKGELGIKSGKGWYDYSGKTRKEVLEERNSVLLSQLKLYKSREKK